MDFLRRLFRRPTQPMAEVEMQHRVRVDAVVIRADGTREELPSQTYDIDEATVAAIKAAAEPKE